MEGAPTRNTEVLLTRDAGELLKEATELPAAARAALAGSLIDSLDEDVDADAEAAWGAEIDRRQRELDAGSVKAVPWSEARKRILGV